jgi:hypothetical protein
MQGVRKTGSLTSFSFHQSSQVTVISFANKKFVSWFSSGPLAREPRPFPCTAANPSLSRLWPSQA